ncbi:VCBS repeat-containing protein [Flavicella sp.]|uniref:VCBS repeat-containing protein n=1 Tax=Flavicella sp. TaxID=2957742 RepID=UPI00261F2602|nr:VCBS repeat-containing protein [Flavicella sp.]MDG1805846.1 VCBS repeat-containing protein [Flavicella sp.]
MKYSLVFLFVLFVSCSHVDTEKQQFVRKFSNETHINFNNKLVETDTLNYFNYPYIYMGGGIAVGDFNNDKLQDLYFTGNMVSNRLYLNKGDLKFEDVTEQANAGLGKEWSLGGTTIDINNDGLLDIYISVSGKQPECPNRLLVNQGIDENGDISFKEQAEQYGIADAGHSTQSTFFDYDNDGDLDLYVANYPITPFKTSPYIYKKHIEYAASNHSNHLYRNNGNGTFDDVTKEAKLLSYSLSLSATVSDLNNDGYQDIYVSNDFASADFCYMNNGDGTFRNTIEKSTKHTSLYGMGADISDFNNDGFLDIMQVDMDASTNKRSKANMASMNPKVFWDTYNSGLYYQYMHNCLQLNTGVLDKDMNPLFNNISRIANVSTTDWSWGPVFADLDNDGWKDLYVSNGTRREINNTDFFNEIGKNRNAFSSKNTTSGLENSLKIPSEKTDNFVFRNSKDLTFEKVNKKWGLSFSGFSNGVVYADLDNDGDLEIILNNIDDEAVVFENKNSEENNAITFEFIGTENNKMGLGVKCEVLTKSSKQFQELHLVHGYLSSMAPQLHFGFGTFSEIENVHITWPDGKSQNINGLAVNKKYVIEYANASFAEEKESLITETLFSEDLELSKVFKHEENEFDDYKNEILLPHKTSMFGPYVSVADVNKDGLDDFYCSGASEQSGGLFFQNMNGGFDKQQALDSENDVLKEDMGSLFFDADNDGDLDLYVVSGGNEFKPNSKELQDRLYINTNGTFTKSKNGLPKITASGSRVYNFDFDKDGDQDLLVCGRLVPGNYPSPAKTYLLENKTSNGTVLFEDITEKYISEFQNLGMVTAASLVDVDGDGWQDIVLVGEWMPIRVFKNNEGKNFVESSMDLGLERTTGWWFSLESGDFDNDGDIDFIAGNLGLNYKYKSSEDETFDIYFNDFDQNDKKDIVLSYYNEGKKFPVRGRSCSSSQVGMIKKKFKTYNKFAEATLDDVYGEENLEKSLHYQVNTFATSYIENKNGEFIVHQLPNEVQLSSVNGLIVKDFDKDGNLDVLAAGNLYASEIETPRNDAGTGVLLLGDGKGKFQAKQIAESGFYAPNDAKDLKLIQVGDQTKVMVSNNNDFLQFIDVLKQ